MKIPVIYWSGTGNTKAMAEAVKEGIEETGETAVLKSVEQAGVDDVKDAKAFALGSPAMGVEELAEEIEVFLDRLEKQKINGKVVGPFGSYNWGEGKWMNDLAERLKKDGFRVVCTGLMIQLTPDEEGLKKCREYGRMIVEAARSG